MILHGNARAGARALALHLMRTDENEHVDVYEVSGFMAEDVLGALREIEAQSNPRGAGRLGVGKNNGDPSGSRNQRRE